MSRCAGCKHWEQRDGESDRGRGRCLMTENKYTDTPRGAAEWYRPEHPESLAVAEDGESYYAVLFTAPEFGCVQWVSK